MPFLKLINSLPSQNKKFHDTRFIEEIFLIEIILLTAKNIRIYIKIHVLMIKPKKNWVSNCTLSRASMRHYVWEGQQLLEWRTQVVVGKKT